jgi:hypothetical protein
MKRKNQSSGIRRRALALGSPFLAALPSLITSTVAQQQKPNVVFILADNVGYGD